MKQKWQPSILVWVGIGVSRSTGSSGGICLMWRQHRVHVEPIWELRQVLFGIVSCIRSSFPVWCLGAIYASTNATHRSDLWRHLTEALSANLPFCLIGDFNQIILPAEKMGGAPFRYDWKTRDFMEFINTNRLRHVHSTGNFFTPGSIFKRLDRGISNELWADAFPDAAISHLPRLSSDHSPLLLQCFGQISNRSSHFRFEDAWLCIPASWDVVRRAWRPPVRGNAFHKLTSCLAKVRNSLRVWNRSYVRNNIEQMNSLEDLIQHLQDKNVSACGLSDSERLKLYQAYSTRNSISVQVESYWKQRSRAAWLTQGD